MIILEFVQLLFLHIVPLLLAILNLLRFSSRKLPVVAYPNLVDSLLALFENL